MGRSYIGIEKGEHAATLCVDRMRKVIAGEPGGVSADAGWIGGGAFHFYKLDCKEHRREISDAKRRR
jgi:adenine-specific DNA-methyltransferase